MWFVLEHACCSQKAIYLIHFVVILDKMTCISKEVILNPLSLSVWHSISISLTQTSDSSIYLNMFIGRFSGCPALLHPPGRHRKQFSISCSIRSFLLLFLKIWQNHILTPALRVASLPRPCDNPRSVSDVTSFQDVSVNASKKLQILFFL